MRSYTVAARALILSEIRLHSSRSDTFREKKTKTSRKPRNRMLLFRRLREDYLRVRKDAAPLKQGSSMWSRGLVRSISAFVRTRPR